MRLIEPNEAASLIDGPLPVHAAIIMDGNGRWAAYRGMERTEGHYAAKRPLLECVRVALQLGIPWLSFYAFSTENWTRPRSELVVLLRYITEWHFTHDAVDTLKSWGVRFHFIGDIDDHRIPAAAPTWLRQLERATAHNTALELVFAFNYGGQTEIVEAARRAIRAGVDPDALNVSNFATYMYLPDMPPVDLLIRPSGEQRLSNFILWHLAYAELVFFDTLWPDFSCGHFQSALAEFQARYRRFGGLPWTNPPRAERTVHEEDKA